MSGQIVNASILTAPRQHNSDTEKPALTEGRIPEDWATKPAKLAQADRDARWTLKHAMARKAGPGGAKAKVESPSQCSSTRTMPVATLRTA